MVDLILFSGHHVVTVLDRNQAKQEGIGGSSPQLLDSRT
jgi:hypothetical protein